MAPCNRDNAGTAASPGGRDGTDTTDLPACQDGGKNHRPREQQLRQAGWQLLNGLHASKNTVAPSIDTHIISSGPCLNESPHMLLCHTSRVRPSQPGRFGSRNGGETPPGPVVASSWSGCSRISEEGGLQMRRATRAGVSEREQSQ